MKALLLVLAAFFASSLVFAQEGLIKSIGTTAKEKANAQDFNTTRNNKERGNLMDDKKSKDSAPVPASSAPVESEVAEPAPSEPSVEYQASYTFTSSLSYSIEIAKSPNATQMYNDYGDQVMRTGIDQDMSSIIDTKNGVMIVLNSKDKTATVMSTKFMEDAMKQGQQAQAEKPAGKITKTGRTKTILGYKCEEILVESEGNKIEIWMTKDTGIDVSKTYSSLNKSQVPKEVLTEGGIMLEMISYDTAGKMEMHMLATALSKETKIVNIGAYKITKL